MPAGVGYPEGSGPTGTVPATTTPEGATRSASTFIAELQVDYPWLAEMGLDTQFMHDVAAESSGPDEILVRLRQTPAYQARFPGLYRNDGSTRMNEATYMQREGDYRQLLRQYGFDMGAYENPEALVGFFSSEQDPNELGQRLETYRKVEQASQSQKDAFYVYAGLDVTTDDLYEAAVDPAARQSLSDRYSQSIAAGSFDYETWITRATEVGLRKVSETLTTLSSRGAMTSAAVQAVISVDSTFARQIMDVIYTNGDPGTPSTPLSLENLLSSFEFAAVGAAANNAGLDLPSRERLAEIRAAGVSQQNQIEAFTQFGQNQDLFNAASQRAGFGGLTQDEFEGAAFFNDGEASRELQTSLAQERSAGQDSGEFRFVERAGKIVQSGLRT
tara:strand:- start:2924 stop:4087 length:1164 start_codon:yes stop_codon:yes gene_type:complete